MSRDIYVSLSGASATWAQLEIVANNLANVSTVGFKQDKLPFKVADSASEHSLGEVYAQADTVRADMSDGPLTFDNDPYHLAMQGQGFFAVQDNDRTLLTRDGSFQLNDNGLLVTNQGMPLIGERGVIRVPEGEDIRIDEQGIVYGSESGEIDRIRTVGATSAERLGTNLWEPKGQMYNTAPRVVQGALEGSNVNALRAMTELIEVSRYFEAYRKSMQTTDDLDTRLNRIGGRG